MKAVRALLPPILALSLTAPAFAQDEPASQMARWALQLKEGASAPSTVGVVNRCSRKHRFRLVKEEDLEFLHFVDETEVQVKRGSQEVVRVLVDATGLPPGRYRGVLGIHCVTCKKEPTCTQDRDLIEVIFDVVDAGEEEGEIEDAEAEPTRPEGESPPRQEDVPVPQVWSPRDSPEQPPGEQNPDAERMRRLFEALRKLEEAMDETRGRLSENPLVEEGELVRTLTELPKLLSILSDERLAAAVKAFLSCDSLPLRELLEEGGEGLQSVIQALQLIDGLLDILLELDKDRDGGERGLLHNLRSRVEQALEGLEKVAAGAEDAGDKLALFDRIKRGFTLPDDLVELLVGHVEALLADTVESKVEEAAEKALEKLVAKLVGSAGAAALFSMAEDLTNFIKALLELDTLEEQRAKYNSTLLELIRFAASRNLMPTSSPGRGNDSKTGGMGPEYDDCRITLSPSVRCFCPKPGGGPGEGRWQEAPVEVEPHDEDDKFRVTFTKKAGQSSFEYKVRLPAADKLPCAPTPGCSTIMRTTVVCEGKPTEHFTRTAGVVSLSN